MNQKKYKRDLQFLQKNQLLQNQLHNEIATYFSNMEFRETDLNEVIYKQGDKIQYLYFIFKGEFLIDKKCEGGSKAVVPVVKTESMQATKMFQRPIQIALLSSGEIFGDENILESKKRQYNVRCSSVKGELYFITIKDFFEKFNEFSHMRILKDYIREKSERYKQRFESAIEQKESILKSVNKWADGRNEEQGQKKNRKRNNIKKKVMNENIFELATENEQNSNKGNTVHIHNFLRVNKNEVNKPQQSQITRQYSIKSVNQKQKKYFENQNFSTFGSVEKLSQTKAKENCFPMIKATQFEQQNFILLFSRESEKTKTPPQKVLKNLFDHLNQQPLDVQQYLNKKKYYFNSNQQDLSRYLKEKSTNSRQSCLILQNNRSSVDQLKQRHSLNYKQQLVYQKFSKNVQNMLENSGMFYKQQSDNIQSKPPFFLQRIIGSHENI